MVKIDSLSFGSIIVDGKKHRHDVTIFPDGQLKRRKGGILMFGSHTFKKKELEEMHERGAEVLVIGTGTNGVAKLAEEARIFAEERKIELIELLSGEAVKKFNELAAQGRRVGAIIHVTC
ncbi:MAG: Mth938-like domain-containing protein [Candidatus Bathyarchaeaceae archaeon]